MSFLNRNVVGIAGYGVTVKELITAISLAILGFIFTTKPYINFINNMTPPTGYFFNLIMFYAFILILSYLGMTFIGFKIDRWDKVFGMFFITYAMLLITNFNSPYFNLSLGYPIENISNIYFQSADGAVWFLWLKLWDNMVFLRMMTYVFTPFALVCIGGFLIKDEVQV